jgi:hypothetical protein
VLRGLNGSVRAYTTLPLLDVLLANPPELEPSMHPELAKSRAKAAAPDSADRVQPERPPE